MTAQRHSRPRAAWPSALLVLLTTFGGAHAASFTVDTTADDPALAACDDATADDCSLRGALVAANGLDEPSTIDVPAGTYVLSASSSCTYRLRDFRIPTLGAGPLTTSQIPLCASGHVSIQGAGAELTVIDADQRGRVLFVGMDGVVELRDLTLRNGLGDRSFGINPNGGGINNHGTLTLVDVVVRDNSLDPGATGAAGAGLYNEKGAALTLRRATVRNNVAQAHAGGGGLWAGYGGTVTIADSVVRDNVIGGQGGGVANGGSTLTIIGSTISGNQTISGTGGGLTNFGVGIQDFDWSGLFPGDVTLVNSTISGNTSGSSGGGIYDHFHSTIRMRNVTITANTGATGSGSGGGITTFTGNGIFLRNTIIAGNVGARGTAPDCDARNVPGSIPLTSEGHNLVQNPTGCVLVGDTTGNVLGQDPKLGLLVDNGGPTPTHAPAEDSPAVDAGSRALPGSGGTACAAVDQRGFHRPLGAACDIGAVERSDGFSLARILPAAGGDTGFVTAVVAGGGFVDGTAVRLRRAGQPDVLGSPAQVDAGGSAIAVTFDLRGRALGAWDVVVTNPDDDTLTLPGAFTVEAGRPADLSVDVVGLLLRPGRLSRLTVFYGNRSNVDAAAVPLSLSVPAGWRAYRFFPLVPPPEQPGQARTDWTDVPVAVPVADDEGGALQVPLLLPVVPAGFTGSLQVGLVQPVDAQETFLLASIGNPLVSPEPDAEAVAAAVAGVQAYLGAADVSVPAAVLAPYVTEQLRLVVEAGRAAFVANLGTAADVYSVSQLHFDHVFFGAAQVAETASLGRASRWLLSLLSRLGPAESRAQQQHCPVPEKGKAAVLVPGCSGGRERTGENPTEFFPPEIPPPPGCNLKDRSTFGNCTPTPDHCESLGTHQIVRGSNGAPYCVPIRPPDNCPKIQLDNPFLGSGNAHCKTWPLRPRNSADPNDKVGTLGATPAQHVTSATPLAYVIHFENLETATAPAQEVVVTDQLDVAALDLETFSLGPIAFGDVIVTPAPGVRRYTGGVDLRPAQDLIVTIDARLDEATGLVTWRFASIDPDTGQLTDDPDAGFLPPNVMPPEGDGSVVFTVAPKVGLGTGTTICNAARIVFDVNAPIDTPAWCNTVDDAPPSSQVDSLAPAQASPTFPVHWAGTDAGSGIARYTVLVSQDGGPMEPWQVDTTAMSATFAGRAGSSYAFASVAQDLVGNAESPPPTPDAVTQVCPEAGCPATTTSPPTTTTTIPAPPCNSVRCVVEEALAGPACGDETVPTKIERLLDRAVTRAETAPSRSPKKAAKLYGSARRLLTKAGKAAAKAAGRKRPKLSADCAAAIREAVSSAVGLVGS
jgi:hypothetical protein